MKKTFTIIAIVLSIALFASCAAASTPTLPAGNTESTQNTQSAPEPSKSPVEKVFGKTVQIAAVSNGDEAASELFFAGVKKEAGELGIEVTVTAAPDDFEEQIGNIAKETDGIVVYLPNKLSSYTTLEDIAKDGIPVSLFELEKTGTANGISQTFYNNETEAETALYSVLTYPPHEAPVRLLSMFENKDSKAYQGYDAGVKEGKIFSKAVFAKTGAASDDEEKDKSKSKDKEEPKETGTPGAWLSGKLDKYVEGMIDAVYAENESLAIEALDALEAKNRTDMEVISIGVSLQTLARMQKNTAVFAQAIGANSAFAGVLNTRIVLNMIKGMQPVTEELKPSIVNAADLKEDPAAALAGLAPEELSKKYVEAWMDELKK